MKSIRLSILLLGLLGLFFQPVQAQSETPLVVVMQADGDIMPAMETYIKRGLDSASQQAASLVVLELNTPGGSIATMQDIITDIRSSAVPVVVYVSPRGAWAGSAGTLITLAGHAAAMAPETVIGAASPVGSGGQELDPTLKAKQTEALTATVRSLTERRGQKAMDLAQSTITDAKAVSADEAYQAGLIDFIATDLNDLLTRLDGFTVQMNDGPRVLHTRNARTEPLNMNLVEQAMLLIADPNISFLLMAVGVLAILIEISAPGGWVAGFTGVVCLALGIYGAGSLPVNWFGMIFFLTAFVLFILDIKAPTHGALTAAGVGSFIAGALILFNSPGTPPTQQVSIPLVILVGMLIGLMFAGVLYFALRAQRAPIHTGAETIVGQSGKAREWTDRSGQVQVESELWSAEPAEGSETIRKGDNVEVVKVEGLRLIVKKK